MKRVPILLLLLFGVACLLPRATAQAASAPHVVVQGEVWLLGEDGNRLFLLPESYYVRIVNLDDAFYYVTFNEVSGKVDRNDVTTTGYHAVAAGTRREIALNPDDGDLPGVYLKRAPHVGAENVGEVRRGEPCTFLGHYPTDAGMWYYVEAGQTRGYVRAERTDFTLSLPTFVPEPEPTSDPDPPTDPTNDPGNDTLLTVLIVLGVSVPAVLIVFVLFRTGKGKKEKY